MMNWKIVLPVLAAVFTVSAAKCCGFAEDADINDEGVQNALQFAVVQHNQRSNDMFESQVSNVIKVQTQGVAGLKYIFTVEMGRTPCRKGGAETVCAVHQDPLEARPYQCKFEVVSQPWMNLIKLIKHECLAQGQSF